MENIQTHPVRTGLLCIACIVFFLSAGTELPVYVLFLLAGIRMGSTGRDGGPLQNLCDVLTHTVLPAFAIAMITVMLFEKSGDLWLYEQPEVSHILSCTYHQYLAETGRTSILAAMRIASVFIPARAVLWAAGTVCYFLKKKAPVSAHVFLYVCLAVSVYFSLRDPLRPFSMPLCLALGMAGMCFADLPVKQKDNTYTGIVLYLLTGLCMYGLLIIHLPHETAVLPVCAGVLAVLGSLYTFDSRIADLIDFCGDAWYEIILLLLPVQYFIADRTMAVMVSAAAGICMHSVCGLRFTKKEILPDICRGALTAVLLYFSLQGYRVFAQLQDPTEELAEAARIRSERTVYPQKMRENYLSCWEEDERLLSDPDEKIRVTGTDLLLVSGIGDSVMLGAAADLQNAFVNGDFDAKVSRSYIPLYSMIPSRISDGTLKDNVLIGIGTNSPMTQQICEEIIAMCADRNVYWITTTNNWQFYNTDAIVNACGTYDNAYLVDWDSYSSDHPEYFAPDGIHLTYDGRAGYIRCIKEAMADSRIGEILEERQKNRTLLIGDAWMLGASQLLSEELDECWMYAEEDFSADGVIEQIQALKDSGRMAKHAVICLGCGRTYETEQLRKLFDALASCDVTVIRMPGDALDGYSGIDHTDLYETHPEYFTADRVHLNEEGYRAFAGYAEDAVRRQEN